jgi:hypothetical protein
MKAPEATGEKQFSLVFPVFSYTSRNNPANVGQFNDDCK